jgi:hypothetical protein
MNQISSLTVGRRRLPACMVIVVAIAAAWLCAPSAFAAAPRFVPKEFHEEAYSTRVMIEGGALLSEGGLATTWGAEYSTSCSAPPSEWTKVNEETQVPSLLNPTMFVFIGVKEEGIVGDVQRLLRHLQSNTSYCARFTAKNSMNEEAKPETIPFRTLPIEPPEVYKKEDAETPPDKGKLRFTSEWSDTTAGFKAEIEGNGADTEYHFEYARAEPSGGRPAETSAAWKPFTLGAEGTITVTEEHARVEAGLENLEPETSYYVRLKMSNSAGERLQTKFLGQHDNEIESFRTGSAKPVVRGRPEFRNVTVTSAHVALAVAAHGSKTTWRFEVAQSVLGPWSTVPGGEGAISQAQAEAAAHYNSTFNVGARLTGLSASTKYYVRLFAGNAAGEGKFCYPGSTQEEEEEADCEPLSEASRVSEGYPGLFETTGLPSVTTFMVHGLVGEALQLDGGVDPNSALTSGEQIVTLEGAPTGGSFTLTFKGHTTVQPIAYNAPAGEGEGSGSVEAALRAIGAGVRVEGPAGGPYTVAFVGSESEPPIEADGSGLTPAGSGVSVKTIFKGGESTETHYRFEYVSGKSFGEHGWSEAQFTAEMLASPSSGLEVVHGLLPVLPAGESYRYRLVARSSIPGAGTIEGPEQTLKVPSFTVEPVQSPCPNEAFRTGLSAHLPDCRAYELLSPIDKEGSQEAYKYGFQVGGSFNIGEDGERAILDAYPVSWGSATAGNSPFLFSRGAEGWSMTAGTPQPQTGVATVWPQLYSGDLSQLAFESRYETSPLGESSTIEYKVGPVGGPYTIVASAPREVTGHQFNEGWVASNAAFSKLVLQTRDRRLLGEPTSTRSGSDLYEYTLQGGLRRLNVTGGEPAVTIGSCGAAIVRGSEDRGGSKLTGSLSSQHTVSAEGSRVFFYASAPHECASEGELGESSQASAPHRHLYVRVNGSQTVDIGAFGFLGANEQGTVLLLENGAGELEEYDSETGKLEPESSSDKALASELGSLGVPNETEPQGSEAFFHPRYTYWSASHVNTEHGTPESNGQGEVVTPGQVYRYDAVEHLVECVSCVSSYDHQPKLPSFISVGSGVGTRPHSPFPFSTFTSRDGRFAFFTTPSALVAQDVDGEIPIEGEVGGVNKSEFVDIAGTTSPSSDVYEWRAAGVDGCERVQGCVALITDGRGGYLNLLLGSVDEGREALIYTRSKLLPQDVDSAGDVYAVRVDGGFPPPPPQPTECEGDACSIPPAAPNDATPSSLTFNGMGNVVPVAPAGKPVAKAKKPKARKHRKNRKVAARHRARGGRRARRSTARGTLVGRGGRGGR